MVKRWEQLAARVGMAMKQMDAFQGLRAKMKDVETAIDDVLLESRVSIVTSNLNERTRVLKVSCMKLDQGP